ncbi:hypothetical protein M422DRAFT_265615 [Sphaerobolus stellatus SS14]|uniref:Uncharacterized protein n=1 Tax=Sphaerobolus stellatus (strain SS14) TaxID=990650 RepID=A0A0C9V587_SPHS4|nr:hypothetical protein M422DRAFT_265615 [Sphaerobolus stellatus SS14]
MIFLNPNLYTAKYPKREIPGSGILGFDLFNLGSPSPSSDRHAPSNRTPRALNSPKASSSKRPATESYGSPLKYRRTTLDSIGSIKGKGKGKGKSAVLSRKPSTGSSFKLPIWSDDEGGIEDGYVSPSPTPRSNLSMGQRTSAMLDLPPCYADTVSVSYPSIPTETVASISTSPGRHALTQYEPNERFFGDVLALAEPIHPSLIAYRNYEVIVLSHDQRDDYLNRLAQGGGLTHELICCLLDKCNCGLYFLKDVLHDVHGPQCVDYIRTRPQFRGLPMSGNAAEAIQDIIHQQPPFPLHTVERLPWASSTTIGRQPIPPSTMASSSKRTMIGPATSLSLSNADAVPHTAQQIRHQLPPMADRSDMHSAMLPPMPLRPPSRPLMPSFTPPLLSAASMSMPPASARMMLSAFRPPPRPLASPPSRPPTTSFGMPMTDGSMVPAVAALSPRSDSSPMAPRMATNLAGLPTAVTPMVHTTIMTTQNTAASMATIAQPSASLLTTPVRYSNNTSSASPSISFTSSISSIEDDMEQLEKLQKFLDNSSYMQ